MRKRLFTALVTSLALAGLGVGSASASASTLTLLDSLAEPATQATFSSPYTVMYAGGGSWGCGELKLPTAITANETDPVTLESTAGTEMVCSVSVGYKKYFSNIKTTGPMTLNADGTGELPISTSMVYQPFGYKCTYSGTLYLNWHSLEGGGAETHYEGSFPGSGGACMELYWSGQFGNPTEEDGEPMYQFLVS